MARNPKALPEYVRAEQPNVLPARPLSPEQAAFMQGGQTLISILGLLASLPDDTSRQRVLNSAAAYFQVKEPWDR